MCYGFNRWHICAAYNMYSILWGHDAYTNGIQSRLRRIRFRPGCSDEFLEKLEPEAKGIYGALVKRHQGGYVAYERLHRRAPHVFPSWPGSNTVGSPRAYLRSLGIASTVLDAVI